MQTRNLLIAAALMSSLGCATISAVPSLAQGPASSQATSSVSTAQMPRVPSPRIYRELTDPRTGYHPVTMPDGDSMGPNIPGRILVGPLQQTPSPARVGFGIFFAVLLLASVVWALFGYESMTRILAKDFGDQRSSIV